MNHIEKSQQLGLSPEDFVIVGGSVLDIYGIRTSEDFDVVVSPEAFQKLKQSKDWMVDLEFKKKWGRERLLNDVFEVSPDLVFEFGIDYVFFVYDAQKYCG